MKKLFLSVFLFILLSPCFSFAADTISEHAVSHHHRVQAHGKVKSTAPVDINHATATELTTLKGIGEKKAAAIISYRDSHGAFNSIDDLSKVKGIGKKSVARLEANNPGRIILSPVTLKNA